MPTIPTAFTDNLLHKPDLRRWLPVLLLAVLFICGCEDQQQPSPVPPTTGTTPDVDSPADGGSETPTEGGDDASTPDDPPAGPPDEPATETPPPVITPTELFVIGNSITQHAPIPAYDWHADWGMAASSANHDFFALLKQHTGLPSRRIYFAGLERNSLAGMAWIDDVAATASSSTAVVVQLADNVPRDTTGIAAFAVAYDALLSAVAHSPRLVCVGAWWYREEVETVVRDACARYGGDYVYIGDLWLHPDNEDKLFGPQYAARFINEHPHDWSMAHIAARILPSLQRPAAGSGAQGTTP